MEYIDLLIATASEYLQYEDILFYLSKTKLIKLTYLVEYYYYRNNQKRLTNEEWFFYLYGPYLFNYDEYLKRSPFSIEEVNEESDFKVVVRDEDYFRKENITDFDVKQLIKKIVAEYGNKNLNEILDFIYFETEPMLYADRRGDKLDFSHIQPRPKIKKQLLENKEIYSIIEKYKIRVKNARAI